MPPEGPGKGPSSEGMQDAVPFDGEVLEKLRGMEQQVQMALLELKKKDQQLAREKSSTGRFKAKHIHLAIKISVPYAGFYVALSVCPVCLWETTSVVGAYFQVVHVTVALSQQEGFITSCMSGSRVQDCTVEARALDPRHR